MTQCGNKDGKPAVVQVDTFKGITQLCNFSVVGVLLHLSTLHLSVSDDVILTEVLIIPITAFIIIFNIRPSPSFADYIYLQ